MHHINAADLPHEGVSRRFVGADNGDTGVSLYLVEAENGAGPGLHTHPYDEIFVVREGRALFTVDGVDYDASAGDIFVIKAGEVHGFRSVGDQPLVQVDIHVSPQFIQYDLE